LFGSTCDNCHGGATPRDTTFYSCAVCKWQACEECYGKKEFQRQDDTALSEMPERWFQKEGLQNFSIPHGNWRQVEISGVHVWLYFINDRSYLPLATYNSKWKAPPELAQFLTNVLPDDFSEALAFDLAMFVFEFDTGIKSNYSKIPRGGTAQGSTITTTFRMVRLQLPSPDNRLEILSHDFTFADSEGEIKIIGGNGTLQMDYLYAPFGLAHCSGRTTQFGIDLTNTPFVIDCKFEPYGWSKSGNATIKNLGKVVYAEGYGYQGGIGPVHCGPEFYAKCGGGRCYEVYKASGVTVPIKVDSS